MVKTRTVAICDICGYMVDAVEIENGMDYSTPNEWSHGKSGNIDICPRCAKKLEKPEWKPRNTRDSFTKGFSYADARKK